MVHGNETCETISHSPDLANITLVERVIFYQSINHISQNYDTTYNGLYMTCNTTHHGLSVTRYEIIIDITHFPQCQIRQRKLNFLLYRQLGGLFWVGWSGK